MHTPCARLLALWFLMTSADAQWSNDPATNLPVSLAPGDQVQPKLAPAPDGGGVWLSWFDGIGTGYDVRLQRLGENGSALLAPGGVLVADRNFSSTQDYGLDVNADGSALLAFRDDRFGGVQITAARLGVDGSAVWGAGGVQLTGTTAFVAAPVISRSSDGGAFVAWTQDSSVRVQRLDGAGVPQWAQDVVLTPPGGSYSAADLKSDVAGTAAVLSFVHQTGGFGSPRRLVAQKFGADGTLLWGAAHVQVFDTGSLQFGNFPDFTTDAAGGAVFSWYDASSSQLQCYVQRILADGSEGFAHNGVAVSTDLTRVRVEPTAWLDPATGRTTVAWREQNLAQSQNGVWVQQLDAAGNRLWTDSGRTVLALSANEVTQVRQAHTLAGTLVFWNISPSFGQGQLFGVRLDGNGFVDLGPFAVSSTPSGKSRLAAADSVTAFAILAWTDDRDDAGDLLVQNVNSDSSLGRTGSESCFGVGCPCANNDLAAGCGNSTADGAYLAGVGSLSVAVDDFALAMTQAPKGSNCILFMGNPAFSGLPVPFGDGLRCIGGSTWRWNLSNTGASGTSLYGPGLAATSFADHPPAFQLQPGTDWIFQLWYRDPSGPCGSGFNVSNAVTATFLP
jgi:hypothetical protein